MSKKRFTESEWRKIFVELNRAGTDCGLPSPRNDTFVAASWNLRQFGGIDDAPEKRSRDIEAYRFIASVIQRFDLVAIQEVKEDLDSLRQLHKLLPDFDLIVSDTAGNYERLAFLYRTGKVRQTDLAAEADIPQDQIQRSMRSRWQEWRSAFEEYGQKLEEDPEYSGRVQLPDTVGFERAPHCVSFDVGAPGHELAILAYNTHIFYGADRDDRTDDFLAFLDWLYGRWTRVGKIFAENFLVFGDMNAEVTSSRGDVTSRNKILRFVEEADLRCKERALKRAKGEERNQVREQVTLYPFLKGTRWVDPPKIGSNLGKNEFYDQIILMARTLEDGGKGLYEIGVFDIPKLTEDAFRRKMTASQRTYQTERIRQQISDHLPIWIRIALEDTF